MTTTADRILATAKAQVGYHEGYSGGHWNNQEKYAAEVPGLAWANGQPWCAVFNSWLDLKAGLRPNIDFPVTASCDAAAAWFHTQRRFSEFPAIGAWILYGTPGNLVHTGRVVAYDASTVTTVEGNTNASGSPEGDGVYLKTHQRASTYIVGYGYPKFPEGIRSADPAYPKPAAAVPMTRGQNVDAEITAGRKAVAANAGHPVRLGKLRAALAVLRSIKPRRK